MGLKIPKIYYFIMARKRKKKKDTHLRFIKMRTWSHDQIRVTKGFWVLGNRHAALIQLFESHYIANRQATLMVKRLGSRDVSITGGGIKEYFFALYVLPLSPTIYVVMCAITN